MKEIFGIIVQGKACRRRLKFKLSAAFWALIIAGCAMGRPGGDRQTGRFEIGLIGDLPYSAEDERKFPNLIDEINKADLAFVVHDGDFQADFRGYRDGYAPCSNETFNDRKT